MPRGKYSNPYAQLGNSAADIVNTFINRKGLESSGYLRASKQMADIDNTRAGTDKILQELAGNDRANSMTANDYNAMAGGDIGAQMEGAQRMGAKPGGMDDILGMLKGPTNQDFIDSNVPLDMRPAAGSYLGQEGKKDDLSGMLTAVLNEQRASRNKKGAPPIDLNDPGAIISLIGKEKAAAFAEYMMNNEGATTGEGLSSANKQSQYMSDDEILNLLYPSGVYADETDQAIKDVRKFKKSMGYTGSKTKAQFDYVKGKGLVPVE